MIKIKILDMMKHNLKKIVSASVLLVVMLFPVSCSEDWNEHYDATVTSTNTLWEAISSQSNLSNFSRVVEACGYDLVLNGSQTFSVFAPTNEALSSVEADSLIAEFQAQKNAGTRSDDNTVVRQFLQNHIALYKHPVSSLTNDSITMMNSKYEVLTNALLGNSKLLTSNVLFNNGVLFTVDKKLDYFPNVFEYLGHDSELDSVYNFLNSYSVYEFNEAKSVPGEIVDGQTVYLDSVSDLKNSLFNSLGLINSEDSTYWLLAPTNAEWNRLLEEYEPYFNYSNDVPKRDSMVYANSRLAIVSGSVFSRTMNKDEAFRDSAVSTTAVSYSTRRILGQDSPYYTYFKPFDSGGIFDGTEDIVCSNGHVRKAPQFRLSKFDTFAQTVKVEGENIAYQNKISNAIDPLIVRQVPVDNPFYNKVSGNTYVEIAPDPATASVNVTYDVPNLLSNMEYDVYGVFVPATAFDTLAVEEGNKPTIVFINRVSYTDQNGVAAYIRVRSDFETKPGVVDTVLFAKQLVIPTSSFGLSEPQVSIDFSCNVRSSQTATYTRTLRLDCIIFKPHDLNATEDESAKRNQIN